MGLCDECSRGFFIYRPLAITSPQLLSRGTQVRFGDPSCRAMTSKQDNKLGRLCIAFGCNNRKGQGKPIHGFESDSDRIKEWISGIEREKIVIS